LTNAECIASWQHIRRTSSKEQHQYFSFSVFLVFDIFRHSQYSNGISEELTGDFLGQISINFGKNTKKQQQIDFIIKLYFSVRINRTLIFVPLTCCYNLAASYPVVSSL
jgi:hypothetical protein